MIKPGKSLACGGVGVGCVAYIRAVEIWDKKSRERVEAYFSVGNLGVRETKT